MTASELWQQALGEIEVSLSKANFHTWMRQADIISYQNQEVNIGVPNVFTKEWFENKFNTELLKIFQNVSDGAVKKISYSVMSPQKIKETRKNFIEEQKRKEKETIELEKNSDFKPTFSPEAAGDGDEPFGRQFKINPAYTFDSFVVGKSNSLCHAGAVAVTKNLSNPTYNPLFIYGIVGVGKTHLVQAIANEIYKLYPGKRVIYISCETFVNDFTWALRHQKIEEFKNHYRTADVLIIDDIQFLTAKETSQEEFFHTFNALYQGNKQIVMTADRPPQTIAGVEDRLITRFQWGMMAEIGRPDEEMRMAIVGKKAEERNLQLDQEVVVYLAQNIHGTIREIEGALNRLKAQFDMDQEELNLEKVKETVKSLVSTPRSKSTTAPELIQTVADFYGVGVPDLKGSSRKKELVVPRQMAMFLLREDMKASFPNIAEEMGGRDHTTAIHAHKKMTKLVTEDEKLKQDLIFLRQKIYN